MVEDSVVEVETEVYVEQLIFAVGEILYKCLEQYRDRAKNIYDDLKSV